MLSSNSQKGRNLSTLHCVPSIYLQLIAQYPSKMASRDQFPVSSWVLVLLFLIMKWADNKGCINERNSIYLGLITLKRKKIGHKTGVTKEIWILTSSRMLTELLGVLSLWEVLQLLQVSEQQVWKSGVADLWSSGSWSLDIATGINSHLQLSCRVLDAMAGMSPLVYSCRSSSGGGPVWAPDPPVSFGDLFLRGMFSWGCASRAHLLTDIEPSGPD